VVTAPTLIQQLHGKVDELRRMSDQLRNGDFLRSVVAEANDPSIWVRGPQIAFCGWIGALDAWMRNQLVGSLDAVRQRIESYVRDFDNAQQAFANGIPGVALPPPPAPVGTPPPNCPYPFVMEVPKGTNPNMNPDLMRKGLGNSLGRAKEELHSFSQKLGDVLTEPAPVPGIPAAPGAPPTRHLPPDAKEAAGVPNSYQAIEVELEKALHDVMDRAQAWEEAQAADDPPSLGGGLLGMPFEKVRDLFAEIEERSRAEAQQAPQPQTTPEAQAPEVETAAPPDQPEPRPQTPEEEAKGRQDAADAVREFPPKDVLNDPERLLALKQKLDDRKGNAAFSAEFVKLYGAENMLAIPRTLQAWGNRWNSFHPRANFERTIPDDKLGKERDPKEIEGILYSFSATLATATTSHQLDPGIEHAITTAKDKQAISWLLSDPEAVFDADFLLEAFNPAIVDQLRTEASRPPGFDPWNKNDPNFSRLKLGNLSPDPKVAVLNALARNPKAAEAAANLKLGKVEIQRPGHDPGRVVVNDVVGLLYLGLYHDDGWAMGHLLDSAHGRIMGRDAAEARNLVDRILSQANDAKDTRNAHEHLRNIGSRQATVSTEGQANAALSEVRENPKHPGRELLLAMGKTHEVAKDFVRDAARGSDYAKEALRNTQSGWDLLVEGLQDPATSADAEKALNEVFRNISKKKGLSNEARRGLALALPQRMDQIADILVEGTNSDGGVNVSSKELMNVLKEIAKDEKAMQILISGAGGWASQNYARWAEKIDKRIADDGSSDVATIINSVKTETIAGGEDMAKMFCSMVQAVNLEGKDREAKAKRILGFYQFGVNLAFETVPGLKSIGDLAVGGHKIPGSVSGAVEDQLKTSFAEGLSGQNPGRIAIETAARTEKIEDTLTKMVQENMMNALARRPGFLRKARMPLPDFMFQQPFDPRLHPDVPFPEGYPETFLRPEFLQTLDGQPAVKLPAPGDPGYNRFRDEIRDGQSDFQSRLYNMANGAADKASTEMKLCLAKALK
jgi:hypothetical protein